ncbi:MAG: hypothetical protein ACYCR4_11325, partial [Acidimicrobiales bacterium]
MNDETEPVSAAASWIPGSTGERAHDRGTGAGEGAVAVRDDGDGVDGDGVDGDGVDGDDAGGELEKLFEAETSEGDQELALV